MNKLRFFEMVTDFGLGMMWASILLDLGTSGFHIFLLSIPLVLIGMPVAFYLDYQKNHVR